MQYVIDFRFEDPSDVLRLESNLVVSGSPCAPIRCRCVRLAPRVHSEAGLQPSYSLYTSLRLTVCVLLILQRLKHILNIDNC
ncbi:hypothetical protein O181_068464 [Austropuccinia psidii MF-1]|uniref:Uncharacterized protein n=1 Tax=Austropuccinia psidii MF-1 TaxID=1389203 RepID=A0A9Q3EWX4_9BASI|nr:hypothetical protein [Austropuccinia psidii MF-1]